MAALALAQGLMVLAALALLAAAINDMVHFEIPDVLPLVILGSGLGYGALAPGFAWAGHLAAPALVLAAGLLVFRLGLMGGGDIKLLVAIAGWTGLAGLPAQLIAVVLCGGGLALLLLAARWLAARWLAAQRVQPARLPRLLQTGAPLPYAVAIAVGTGWWAFRAWPLG
jgi:prepilin peptidase CpaA